MLKIDIGGFYLWFNSVSWYFTNHVKEHLPNNLNYLFYLANCLLWLLYLLKDWDAHKKSWRRVSAICLIIFIGIIGIVNTYYLNLKNERDRQEYKESLRGWKISFDTVEQNRKDDRNYFYETFGSFQEKLSELKNQMKIVGLQKEADRLTKELEETRNTLNKPEPKATLSFTFNKQNIDDPPLRVVTLPVVNDIVHVEFCMKNDTEVAAINGVINLVICKACKFAGDPPGFKKMDTLNGPVYIMKFDRMLPKTESQTMSADIIVPSNAPRVEFGATYRCTNCDTPGSRINCGTINLIR